MYKYFVERCERNNIKCTFLEAISVYGVYNYQEILHPKLKNRVEIPYEIDLTNTLSEELLEKVPELFNVLLRLIMRNCK